MFVQRIFSAAPFLSISSMRCQYAGRFSLLHHPFIFLSLSVFLVCVCVLPDAHSHCLRLLASRVLFSLYSRLFQISCHSSFHARRSAILQYTPTCKRARVFLALKQTRVVRLGFPIFLILVVMIHWWQPYAAQTCCTRANGRRSPLAVAALHRKDKAVDIRVQRALLLARGGSVGYARGECALQISAREGIVLVLGHALHQAKHGGRAHDLRHRIAESGEQRTERGKRQCSA